MTIVRVTKNGLEEISDEALDIFTDKVKKVRIKQVPSYAFMVHTFNSLKITRQLKSPARGEVQFNDISVHKWRKPQSTKVDFEPDDEIKYNLYDFDIGCVYHTLNSQLLMQYQWRAWW